jgi:pSer/pThr/pTyr-binding forkhead associated (FHA) protein
MTLPPGKLVLTLSGGQEQEFALAKSNVALGRAVVNDVVLSDAQVSRHHARVEKRAEGYTLVDLGSANGTLVNGVRVSSRTLAPGDVIRVGDSTLRFEIALPRREPDVTRIDSQAELEMTLAQVTMVTMLNDTRQPRLTVHTPGKTWQVPLVADALTIGRDPGSDIYLDDRQASRHHARIERRGEVFVIRDLASANGTWRGEQRIEEDVLQNGDTIRIGQARLVFMSGFAGEELTIMEPPQRAKQPVRRPVVIVPGIMGSELWRGDEQVWPDVRLLYTCPETYALPDKYGTEARGLVKDIVIVPNLIKLEQYSRLGDYLVEGLGYERGKDLLEFGYDWRQDVRESARHLAETIDRWRVSPPITIIAHSMGCLVSRYYVECLGGTSQVGRLILIGGPNAGTPKAFLSLLFGPGLFPLGLVGERLRQLVATFPSMYQMVPIYACAIDQRGQRIDLYRDVTWLPEAHRPLLRAARAFRKELGTRVSVPAISIFGYGLKTTTGIVVERDRAGGWQKVDPTVEPAGDETIPEISAVVEGSEIHPVQQQHGALYVDNDVKMRLKIELAR